MLLSIMNRFPEKARKRFLKFTAHFMLADLILLILALIMIWVSKSESDMLYRIAGKIFFIVKILSGIIALYFLFVGAVTFIDEFNANGRKYLFRFLLNFFICYPLMILISYLPSKEWHLAESAAISFLLILLPVMRRGAKIILQYGLSAQNEQDAV